MATKSDGFGYNIELENLEITKQVTKMDKAKTFITEHVAIIVVALTALVGVIAYKVFKN